MEFLAPAVSDDEVFRRKLLMDGEGLGDDKRLSILLKGILKWCDVEEPKEEARLAYDRLITLTDTCVLTMTKSTLVQKINQAEAEYYDEKCKEFEAKIMQTRQQILECKAALKEAKESRKQREAYNGIVDIIKKLPDRNETVAELEEVNGEIHALKEEQLNLSKKLNQRNQWCYMLATSAYEVKQVMKGEDNISSDDDFEETHIRQANAMETDD